jgi:hypothetical protein
VGWRGALAFGGLASAGLVAGRFVVAECDVARDAVEPRERLIRDGVGAPPRDQERLGGDLVRRIGANTTRRVGVNRAVVLLVERRERGGAAIHGQGHIALSTINDRIFHSAASICEQARSQGYALADRTANGIACAMVLGTGRTGLQ